MKTEEQKRIIEIRRRLSFLALFNDFEYYHEDKKQIDFLMAFKNFMKDNDLLFKVNEPELDNYINKIYKDEKVKTKGGCLKELKMVYKYVRLHYK